MGYATAKIIALASPSYHVILAGRSAPKLTAAKSSLEKLPLKGTLSTLVLDVTSPSSISAATSTVASTHDHLDVLINNAGIYTTDPDPHTRYTETLTTNVIGPVLVSAAFRELLLKAEAPYTIYVSSGLGSMALASDPASSTYRLTDLPRLDAYRVSKAALDMVALQEHIETTETSLKVFVVCPGLVESNLRGESDVARTAGGNAGSADVSGETVLGIMEGKRDGEVGKFVHKDGVYGW